MKKISGIIISRPGTLDQNRTIRVEKPAPLVLSSRPTVKVLSFANALGNLLAR